MKMSWLKRDKRCSVTCPVFERLLQKEAARGNIKVSQNAYQSPNSLSWRVEALEDLESSLSNEVARLKSEVRDVKAVLDQEITLCRPVNLTSIMLKIDVIESREHKLSALICKQKRRSDELEARILELENRNKEININIITKTEEAKVELQKGE